MNKENPFSAYYRTVSTIELLTILENPADYQLEALEAARNEWNNRGLSQTDVEEAKRMLIISRQQMDKRNEKIRLAEDKVKKSFSSFANAINPIQEDRPAVDRVISLMTIFFTVILIYDLSSDFRTVRFALKYIITSTDSLYFIILFPFLILIPGIITFWRRKTIGWILLVILLSFSAVSCGFAVFDILTSKFSMIYRFSPRPSFLPYVIRLLFVAGAFYTMCRRDLRNVFKIDNQAMIITLVSSGLSFILLVCII